MLGTSGNLSVLIEKNPLNFLITVSGKDKGDLKENDFILVNEDGFNVENGTSEIAQILSPSAETLLHSMIYKNTDSTAVFHIHSTNNTLLSMKYENCIDFEGLEMIKGLGYKTHERKISIPIINNNQDMKFLSTIAGNIINEDIPGLLIKGHGIYAWGKTPQEAKRHIEIFEFLFEYKLKELLLRK